ncbi:MAG: MFS transporter [Planctomycetota bacterium]|nr:MFS transporter [Planctomycetota bacterium]
MTPVETAVNSVRGAIASFHPRAMPRLARVHYRREAGAWLLISTMMGAVAAGVVSVIAKNAYADAVPEKWLNVAVALLTGAGAYAHLSSFLWASLSHGLNKIRFLTGLQVAAAALVAMIALAPTTGWGLVMFTVGAVLTQICWSGVVTLRSTVWRANYARNARAKMAGKIATFQAFAMVGSSLCIGVAMRYNPDAFHFLYPLAAVFGLTGAGLYSRMRMRGHRALLAAENRDENGRSQARSLPHLWRIVRRDRPFRYYLILMMILGFGNHMANAPLVIMLRDVFGYGYLVGILITASIPILMMPMSIPIWAPMLDRMHIADFRAVHSWMFVLTIGVLLLAATLHLPALLWVAAVLRGLAFGGGVLGWNLGTHDFASDADASLYMGVHVTLTGARGLVAPILAVALYNQLNAWQDGAGQWVFAICLGLVIIGAIGFAALKGRMSSDPHVTEVARSAPPREGV